MIKRKQKSQVWQENSEEVKWDGTIWTSKQGCHH